MDRLDALLGLTDEGLLLLSRTVAENEGSIEVIDPDLGPLGRFGRRGRGPGEVEFLGGLVGGRGVVTVQETGGSRFIRYDISGKHLWTAPAQAPVALLAVRGDSMDVVWEGGEVLEIRRLDIRRHAGRVLLAAGDSTVLAWRGPGSPGSPVGFASFADGRVVSLNPMTYELQFHDHLGTPTERVQRGLRPRLPTPREVNRFAERLQQSRGRPYYGPDGRAYDLGAGPTEAERLEAYRIRPLPHFHGLGGGAWTEGTERLWVLGQANDSTWLDLFEGPQFVRRWTLPCAGTDRQVSSAAGGGYLVLLCEVDDPTGEVAARIQLYRMDGARE